MSERLPRPLLSRFPALSQDPRWVREVPAGVAFSRVFRAGGAHPSAWHDFREYGPLDARFDSHPEPVGDYPDDRVMYTVMERPDAQGNVSDSAFASCLLEVFQRKRVIRRSVDSPTLAVFENARPLRLLDLSDSDWVAAAGGNSAITSGSRSRAREWARTIREAYPELDGVLAASSIVPSARIAALWAPAVDAIPSRTLALIRLDHRALTELICSVAERYGYTLL